MTNPRILDCTLRDGGFYTDWAFRPELVSDLVLALDRAGVDIIELGYRSPNQLGRSGAFKYCDETALAAYLPSVQRAQLAFMIDAKEAMVGHEIDRGLLAHMICPREQSRFAWARVASHPETMSQALEIASWLKQRGYAVAVNVMGAGHADITSTVRAAASADIDALYLADSFGSLTPDQTAALVRNVRRGFAGAIGVHLHDNLGLALANALAALDAGATFVDTTVAGMGRGAGNVRTEELLPFLARYGRHDLDSDALQPALTQHLLPLHHRYRWGPNHAYKASALSCTHPTYVQELEARGHYDLDEIIQILGELPVDRRARFEQGVLAATEERHADRTLQRRSS